MKQSFIKTILGHEMEFVRLMYPLRYEVHVRIPNSNPLKIKFSQTPTGLWEPDENEQLPGWIHEMTLRMQEAIEENEAAPQVNQPDAN